MKMITKILIQDDLSIQDNCAIEVDVNLSDGQKRWCWIMTPTALQSCGDWIDGTKIRFHYGSKHLIIISEKLTEELIHKALHSIDNNGEIIDCTLFVDEDV